MGTTTSYEEELIISSSGKHGSISFCSHGKPGKTCCPQSIDTITSTHRNKMDINSIEKSDHMNIGHSHSHGHSHSITNGGQGRKSSKDWSHCHSPDRDPNESRMDKKARRKLIIACILCLCFMAAECVGGYLANSLAIATDAAHLLTDLASFLISLFSIYLASRPASSRFSFGWYRAEVVGALTSVLLIWVVTGILVYIAIERLIVGKFDIEPTIMLITAGIGVLVNLIMGLQLHGLPGGHGHSHGGGGGHGHSHGGAMAHSDSHDAEGGHGPMNQERENINVRAALIHVIGDFVQSLGVLIAAIVIYFYPTMVWIDPVCTFLFSILVLFTTYTIMKDVLNVFMEGIPSGIDFVQIRNILQETKGVILVHNLRIWSLSLDKVALSAHLAVDDSVEAAKVLKVASHRVRSRFDIFELTIQVEPYKDEMGDCNQCQDPVPS